jgi:formylmethanofuran dehydrogenase subunit E
MAKKVLDYHNRLTGLVNRLNQLEKNMKLLESQLDLIVEPILKLFEANILSIKSKSCENCDLVKILQFVACKRCGESGSLCEGTFPNCYGGLYHITEAIKMLEKK